MNKIDRSYFERLALRNNKGEWLLTALSLSALPEIMALHQFVVENLPEAEKSFILPRDENYFRRHLTGIGGDCILGGWHDGRLIAKGVIVLPSIDIPLADRAGSVAPRDVPPEQTSILQSVTVHPEYRNNGIMQAILRHWLAHAQAQGKTHALAEIEVRNAPSWHAFLKAGLHIVSLGASPIDGAQVYSAHEWLPHQEPAKERIKYALRMNFDPIIPEDGGEQKFCAQDDLAQQQDYLAAGFVVASVDKAGKFILQRPIDKKDSS